MGNPYHDRRGRFTTRNGSSMATDIAAGLGKQQSLASAGPDARSAQIASRWAAMTPDQQRAERRRMVSAITAPDAVDLGDQDIDKQAANLKSRWESMTPAQQKAERQRALELTLSPIRRGVAPTGTTSLPRQPKCRATATSI